MPDEHTSLRYSCCGRDCATFKGYAGLTSAEKTLNVLTKKKPVQRELYQSSIFHDVALHGDPEAHKSDRKNKRFSGRGPDAGVFGTVAEAVPPRSSLRQTIGPQKIADQSDKHLQTKRRLTTSYVREEPPHNNKRLSRRDGMSPDNPFHPNPVDRKLKSPQKEQCSIAVKNLIACGARREDNDDNAPERRSKRGINPRPNSETRQEPHGRRHCVPEGPKLAAGARTRRNEQPFAIGFRYQPGR